MDSVYQTNRIAFEFNRGLDLSGQFFPSIDYQGKVELADIEIDDMSFRVGFATASKEIHLPLPFNDAVKIGQPEQLKNGGEIIHYKLVRHLIVPATRGPMATGITVEVKFAMQNHGDGAFGIDVLNVEVRKPGKGRDKNLSVQPVNYTARGHFSLIA